MSGIPQIPATIPGSISRIPGGIRTIYVGGFRVTRRGRFWVVTDPQETLVCVAVYKKGALEVVRRLLPPDLRHLVNGPHRQTERV